MQTKTECMADFHGSKLLVPAGTEVIGVMGGTGLSYAVKDERLVAKWSHDRHSAAYYYAWVPTDAIEFD